MEQLIKKWETSIANIKWHLKTNADFISLEEKRYLSQRIEDFQEFIHDLNQL